jgi:putative SOS response-associated peptidase YedK
VLLAETFRRDGDADADWKAPFGHRDHVAGIAGHSKFGFCSIKRSHSRPVGSSRLAPAPRPGYARAMCGRVRLSSDVSEIKLVFSIPPHRPTPNIAPSWNVAPTDPLPVVRYDAKAGERSLDVMRWGLVPFWAKDIKVGFANINAKAEGIEGKPAFREAFQRRRCLVPVDNFYEWKKTAAGKQPYAIALADRRLMALAGLWENWRSSTGEWVRSFAIMTTTPNELCVEIHNRMPVVLKTEAWPVWLGEEPADPRQLKALLAPYPAEEMTCWPVSARVGNVKNNDPSLIEPIAGR